MKKIIFLDIDGVISTEKSHYTLVSIRMRVIYLVRL